MALFSKKLKQKNFKKIPGTPRGERGALYRGDWGAGRKVILLPGDRGAKSVRGAPLSYTACGFMCNRFFYSNNTSKISYMSYDKVSGISHDWHAEFIYIEKLTRFRKLARKIRL